MRKRPSKALKHTWDQSFEMLLKNTPWGFTVHTRCVLIPVWVCALLYRYVSMCVCDAGECLQRVFGASHVWPSVPINAPSTHLTSRAYVSVYCVCYSGDDQSSPCSDLASPPVELIHQIDQRRDVLLNRSPHLLLVSSPSCSSSRHMWFLKVIAKLIHVLTTNSSPWVTLAKTEISSDPAPAAESRQARAVRLIDRCPTSYFFFFLINFGYSSFCVCVLFEWERW